MISKISSQNNASGKIPNKPDEFQMKGIFSDLVNRKINNKRDTLKNIIHILCCSLKHNIDTVSEKTDTPSK